MRLWLNDIFSVITKEEKTTKRKMKMRPDSVQAIWYILQFG